MALLMIVAGGLTALPCTVAAASAAAQPEAGDIVLRHGNGFWSRVFAGINRRDRRFSHAGVVVRDQDGLQVVHAEADETGAHGQVRLDDFESYTAGSRQFILLRLDDPAAAGRVARAALAMHAAALPFDFDFDLVDGAAVYCSELVWRSLVIALERDPLPDKPLLAGREAVLIENFLLDVPDLHAVGAGDSGP